MAGSDKDEAHSDKPPDEQENAKTNWMLKIVDDYPNTLLGVIALIYFNEGLFMMR